MNICVTVNSKYMRYLYIMLVSLFENNKGNSIDLYVLERDFTNDDKIAIRRLSDLYSSHVFFIHVNADDYEVFKNKVPRLNTLSIEIFFRLSIPDLLPQYVDKVLMLDVDLVINKDLSELYQIDFGECCLAAAPNICHNMLVEEEWKKWYGGNRTNWTHYNTGILLWNLSKIREKYGYKYIYNRALEMNIQTPTFEEEVFNVLFGENEIKPVSAEKWNYIVTHIYLHEHPNYEVYMSYDEIKEENAIIHYAAQNPWNVGAKNDYFNIWWSYAKKTPYFIDILSDIYVKTEKELARKIDEEKKASKHFDYLYNRIKKLDEILEYMDFFQSVGNKEIIVNFLLEQGINEVILYGFGKISRSLYALLKGTECVVTCFCDKNYKGVYDKQKVVAIDEVDKYSCDAIVVTTPYYYDEIVNDLNKVTNKTIISINDIIPKS